jgi:Ni/Co efflux regulator RcnB
MQKTILTILASSLLAASTIQFAAAAEHHRGHKLYRTHAPVSEDIRNSNAYDAPVYPTQPDWSDYSRYQNGAESAPAGR